MKNHNHINTDIDDDIKKVAEELESLIQTKRKRQEQIRFNEICSYYDIFMKFESNKDIKDFVYLNKHLLAIAIKSYFDDIYSHKIYAHSTDKISAYTIKWIANIKPIQIKELDANNSNIVFNPKIAEINSSFAMSIGLFMLDFKHMNSIAKIKEDIILDKNTKYNIYDKLLYIANFKELCPKQLSIIMATLKYYIDENIELKHKIAKIIESAK